MSERDAPHQEEFGHVEDLVHIQHHDTLRHGLNVNTKSQSNPENGQKDSPSTSSLIRRRLFGRRHLMQYFHDEVLYRTAELRKITPNELFLDLVIVGNVGELGEHFRLHFNGWKDVEQLILLFAVLYHSWWSLLLLWNTFGLKGDFFDKISIFVAFFSLTGVALGASSAFEGLIGRFVSIFSFTSIAAPSICMLIWAKKEPLLRNTVNLINQISLIASVSLVSSLPYFVSIFFASDSISRALFWVPLTFNLFSSFFTASFYSWIHRDRKDATRLAIAIELYSEKYTVLTMIFLGESVLAIVFEIAKLLALPGANVGALYGSAACAGIILYSLQTLYTDIDNHIHQEGTHAIRSGKLTAVLWEQLHKFYHFCLVLLSAGLGIAFDDIFETTKLLSSSSDLTEGIHVAVLDVIRKGNEIDTPSLDSKRRWVFTIGWGGAILLSMAIGLVHSKGRHEVTRKLRYLVRFVVTTSVMVVLPFINISGFPLLGIYTVVAAILAVFEFTCVEYEKVKYIQTTHSHSQDDDEDKGFLTDLPSGRFSLSDSSDLDSIRKRKSIEQELRKRLTLKDSARFVVHR